MKYIGLLRGINVGGNNKVSMAELKRCFQSLGYKNVQTYINSGNVIFNDSETDIVKLVQRSEKAVEETFGFRVICTIISAGDLAEALRHAPSWWGIDNSDKHNAIFVIPPLSPEKVMLEIGEAKPEYEKVAFYDVVIFWTAPLKTFGRTRYSKIVSTSAYQFVTIRNANTVRKLVELSQ